MLNLKRYYECFPGKTTLHAARKIAQTFEMPAQTFAQNLEKPAPVTDFMQKHNLLAHPHKFRRQVILYATGKQHNGKINEEPQVKSWLKQTAREARE